MANCLSLVFVGIGKSYGDNRNTGTFACTRKVLNRIVGVKLQRFSRSVGQAFQFVVRQLSDRYWKVRHGIVDAF
jgi:hypothetical protein